MVISEKGYSLRLAAAILAVGVALGGCGTANVHVREKLLTDGPLPKTVAILPFTTEKDVLEKEKKPHEILREVFYAYFSYLGYSDLPLEEVDRRLIAAGVPVERNDPQKNKLGNEELAKILGVEAVIRGHILKANNFTGGLHSETLIKARLEMTELKTGIVAWKVDHEEMDYSGIATPSFIDIVQQQVENAKVQHAYYKTAEAFALQVVQQIPDPAVLREKEVRLPRIADLRTNLRPGRVFHAGEVLRVAFIGPEGYIATFDIGNWKSGVSMQEIAPGRYSGTYEVVEGDRIADALIIANLKDPNGLSGKKYFKAALVHIDATSTQAAALPVLK